MEASDHRMPYREYAPAIFELTEEGFPVIQARIADWLGVSRASVSETIKADDRLRPDQHFNLGLERPISGAGTLG